MSPSKTAAGCKGVRFSKSAATSALALTTLAVGVMLSGGEGKAVSFCAPPGDADGNMIPGPAICNVEDTNLGFPPVIQQTRASYLPFNPGTSAGFRNLAGTNISYELTGLQYPLAQTQIDTDFNVPGTGNYTGGLISSVYRVEGLNGTKINGIDLTASGSGSFTVKKEVFSDAGLTNKITPDLDLIGSGFRPVQGFAPQSEIYIRDTFNNPVLGQSSIDNAQNTVRTPGPLPILGAGAAFGFSRKLRSRIKASRAA